MIQARIQSFTFFCFLLLSPYISYAQTSCGSIFETYGVDTYETPIADCANPFGVVNENPNLRVTFGTTQVKQGGVYSLVGSTSPITLAGTQPEANYIVTDVYKTVPLGYEKINQDDNGNHTFLDAGTYTFVVQEGMVILVQNFFQKFFSFFVPPAYAFTDTRTVITFTMVDAPVQPTGISNILFLPGIQASRLYTGEGGGEEKLWEPFGDDDVEMLRMTDAGESVHDVYTKDVVDELPDGSNIYKSFVQYLIDLDDAHGGPMVTTFPYDWRHDVFDIVENGTQVANGDTVRPIDSIATSASLSPTGKVTIIAHSNGGLLAKAIMLKLQEEGRTNLVDKVIFIASPHIGTPKGLAALLHGYDQEHLGGLISSDEKVRSVMENMPGVYGLLPSEAYINTLTEPMISFDDSDTTALYRNKYGFTISNMSEYVDFLKGVEGRGNPGDQINEIGTTNSAMLENAIAYHREQLDGWSAPAGIEVFNIVGTGLPTPKSIEYGEFSDLSCTMYGCTSTKKLEPVLHFTRYGDETVISKSASSLGTSRHYIDLFSISEFVHANITESNTVQTLVDYILHSSSTEGIKFVSNTEPAFSTNSDILTIHSPARIYLRDAVGNITGRTTFGGDWQSKIPNSNYFEAGGVKYVIVPSDISYEVVIEGEGNGVYTHELKILQGDTETLQNSFTASITPTTITRYQKIGNTFSIITVDINGDGKIDTEMTQDGKILESEEDDENDDKNQCKQHKKTIHNFRNSDKCKKVLLEHKHQRRHTVKDTRKVVIKKLLDRIK